MKNTLVEHENARKRNTNLSELHYRQKNRFAESLSEFGSSSRLEGRQTMHGSYQDSTLPSIGRVSIEKFQDHSNMTEKHIKREKAMSVANKKKNYGD